MSEPGAKRLSSETILKFERIAEAGSRFDTERVFKDSLFTAGLIGVAWISVKLGLSMFGLKRIVEDPGVAARGIAIASKRGTLTELRRQQRLGEAGVGRIMGGPQGVLRRPKDIQPDIDRVQVELDVLLLEEEEAEAEESVANPALPVLKSLDRGFNQWGAILPVAAVAGNIGFELLRVRKMRGVNGNVGT